MKLPSFFRSNDDAPFERVEPPSLFKNASPESPNTNLADPASWLVEAMGGGPSDAGVSVSESSAMKSTTVYRCVGLIAGLVASLPLEVFDKLIPKGRQHVDAEINYLLHDEPNADMSSFQWRQLMVVDLLLGGNHYSLIDQNNGGEITGFFPIPRNVCEPFRDSRNRKKYEVQLADGPVILDQADVLHIPGLGFDGLQGISPISYVGKNTVGLDLAIQQGMSAMYANGVRASGLVELPARIDEKNFKRITSQLENKHSGSGKWGKVIYGDVGSKFHPITISPIDMQTLESRRFGVTDICRLFGVPPHLAMETDASTSWGTGIEQQSLAFLRFSLEPWLQAIEHELKRKLFSRTRRYAEFERAALLAMDAKTQHEIFASCIQNGVMEPGEVRDIKNLPEKPEANVLLVNSTLVPIKLAGKQKTAEPAPKPKGEDATQTGAQQ